MDQPASSTVGPDAAPPPHGPGVVRSRFVDFAAAAALLLGLTALLGGWLLDIPALRSFPLGTVAVKANTAVALALAGAALWLLQPPVHGGRRRAGRAAAALVALIGLLTLAEHGLGRDFGIDELLFTDPDAVAPQAAGRPARNTALALLLLGLSLLALDSSVRAVRRARATLALGAGFVAAVGLLAWTVGEPSLYTFAPFGVMALSTAVAILLLVAGLLAARSAGPAAAGSRSAPSTFVVGMGAALALLATVTWLNWQHADRAQRSSAWVARTHEIQTHANRLLALVTDVETGTRGFVITGDSAFLAPFEHAVDAMAKRQRALASALPDSTQEDLLASLDALIAERIALSRRILELRRAAGFEAARLVVASGEGRTVMNRIRDTLAAIEASQQALLAERTAAARRESDKTRRLMVVGTVLATLLLLAVFALLLRENRLRRGAQDELDRFFTISLDLLGIAGVDGYFKRLNPAFGETLGHATDELLARPFLDFVHPDDREATLAEIAKLQSGAPTLRFENRYRCRDGTWKWLSWRVQPFPQEGLLYASARDVSEQRRVEQSLREANSFLDSVIENVPNMLFVKDADELRFVRFNRAGEALLGYPREQLVGRNDYDFFPREQADQFTAKDREVLASGELVDVAEEPIDRADGERRILHTKKIPLLDESGRPQFLLGISEDITARKRAEAEIVALNADLEQRAAQLELANQELEAFSYSVSHDLRAPLRHIQGFAELLATTTAGQLPEKADRHLRTIRDASVQMGRLIDDLLAFSRIGRVELQARSTSLEDLLRETLAGLELQLTGRDIVWRIEPLPAVLADPALLRQVLANLLDNAVKYSRRRPRAEITVGTAGDEDGRAILFVRDNGAGFDMRYAAQLFGVFQRLHRADEFEGTGIGLALVRRIVARHGGRTWAEGEVDRGATVYFTLQRAPRAGA